MRYVPDFASALPTDFERGWTWYKVLTRKAFAISGRQPPTNPNSKNCQFPGKARQRNDGLRAYSVSESVTILSDSRHSKHSMCLGFSFGPTREGGADALDLWPPRAARRSVTLICNPRSKVTAMRQGSLHHSSCFKPDFGHLGPADRNVICLLRMGVIKTIWWTE